ncbi:MAG: alanine--glyoxylate aminotransferase family protein [Planctomycetota bacterium]|nr:MAG: alanine--glyoxylate aminotransferase family protein [Planctomycetota bacterium]
MPALPPSLDPPRRVLLGPGPSEVPASVLQAMARPTLGHLDPRFLALMDEIREMLRGLFGTANGWTLPMSGTGSAGMETVLVNLLEPGDRVLVGVNGVFGGRIAEAARRVGAEAVEVAGEWGRALDPDDFRRAARAAGGSFRLLALVHAETSTGVLQPMEGWRELADELGALLVADVVTALGGTPVRLDEWGVDAAFAGSQKCLSCPPGLAPVSLSPRAVERLQTRREPVRSWYLDLNLIARYWGGERAYHHTAPVNLLYALHEACRLALAEGLEQRAARHRRLGAELQAGLEGMGLELRVPAGERLPQLTAVAVPDDVADAPVRRFLLEEFGVEIGGGLGPMAGNTWRIGLMGAGCTRANVALVQAGLRAALAAPVRA